MGWYGGLLAEDGFSTGDYCVDIYIYCNLALCGVLHALDMTKLF